MVDVTVRAQDDDGDCARAGVVSQALDGLESAHDRHLEVHDDEVRPSSRRCFDGFGAVSGLQDLEASDPQVFGAQFSAVIIVVDQQNTWRSGHYP
jgi:hypothetical protein